MKAIILSFFLSVVSALSAQDYDYMQNGIEPRFTDKWDYERISTPPNKKHDSSTGNSTEVNLFPNDSLINQKDENGLKQGHWIIYGRDRPESGIPANGKVEEGKYINDKKEGIWIKYHNDGVTPKLKGEYKNNRPAGNYTKTRGDIIEIGNFEKNQYRDSLVRGSGAGGTREYEAFYNENGKEDGRVNFYYPNGQLEYTYTAKNGIPTGQATRYYKNGDIKELIDFADDGSVIQTKPFEAVNPITFETKTEGNTPPSVGNTPNTHNVPWKPNGYNKVYNDDDELWQDGVFKEGKLFEGKFYIYDTDGILLKVKVYKSGAEH